MDSVVSREVRKRCWLVVAGVKNGDIVFFRRGHWNGVKLAPRGLLSVGAGKTAEVS